MRIKAYTYWADVHCPPCTEHAASVGILKRKPPMQVGTDGHGTAFDLIDPDGNPIHPVYDIDEDIDGVMTHCGDCLEAL